MEAPGARLEAILLEIGDLWLLCGRTKITVVEVPGAHGLKTIHRGMTREWAQANRAHAGMTLVDVEDLEAAGLIDVDWGISNSGGRRGELRLTQTGARFVQARQPPADTTRNG
jgi:hypothetical protein